MNELQLVAMQVSYSKKLQVLKIILKIFEPLMSMGKNWVQLIFYVPVRYPT